MGGGRGKKWPNRRRRKIGARRPAVVSTRAQLNLGYRITTFLNRFIIDNAETIWPTSCWSRLMPRLSKKTGGKGNSGRLTDGWLCDAIQFRSVSLIWLVAPFFIAPITEATSLKKQRHRCNDSIHKISAYTWRRGNSFSIDSIELLVTILYHFN